MSRSLLIGACLVLGCTFGLFVGSPSAGQRSATSSSLGQFQMVVTPSNRGPDNTYVLNTQTGQVWRRDNNAPKWIFLGTPAASAEK
jgi:hypothetical protein